MKVKLLIPILVLTASTFAAVQAQTSDYVLSEESSMVIEGTSTIHDWKADVEEMDLSASMNASLLNQKNPQNPFSSLTLEVPVKSIESGKGGMNKKIYGALKEKDHPYITFNLVSAELVDGIAEDGSFKLNVKGDLTIAGASRSITLPVEGQKGNEVYSFQGSYKLNMRDFNVDPPSAVFGTIKSGEEVTITFDFKLQQQLAKS